MVENISPRPLLTPSLLLTSRLGKTAVPVKPLQSVYAQFKHITGVPSRAEGGTVPLNKLWHLDKLIDRLVRIRNGVVRADTPPAANGSPDLAIEQAHREIRAQMIAEKPLFGGMFSAAATGAGNAAGTLVDLVA